MSERLASEYLAFRAPISAMDAVATWRNGLSCGPLRAAHDAEELHVSSAEELVDALAAEVRAAVESTSGGELTLMLSGGVDSALLAALVPKDTLAITVLFEDGDEVEATRACAIAEYHGLEHQIVTVTADDYLNSMGLLMHSKGFPIHPVEPALYVAGSVSAGLGRSVVIMGNGADTHFGGHTIMLTPEWESWRPFLDQFLYVDPAAVLKSPVSFDRLIELATDELGLWHPDELEPTRFMAEIHGQPCARGFENAMSAAGVRLVEPFARLFPAGGVPVASIRAGRPKPLINAAFSQLHPDFEVHAKIPFKRPSQAWFENGRLPGDLEHRYFRDDIDWDGIRGDRRLMVFALDRFLVQHHV